MTTSMDKKLNCVIKDYQKQSKDEQYDYNKYEDEYESSKDIAMFEHQLKFHKGEAEYDSSIEHPQFSPETTKDSPQKSKLSPIIKKQTRSMSQPKGSQHPLSQSSEFYLSMDSGSPQPMRQKIEKLKFEITKHKLEAMPKTEEEKIQDVIQSNDIEMKNQKLKELMRKNRELTLLCEREKVDKGKLYKDFDRLKKETDMSISHLDTWITKSRTRLDIDWKLKYLSLEKMFNKLKLDFTMQKNDLNKAHRVLKREVGHEIDIDSVLSGESGWKGRAQQIELLKHKVKELDRLYANNKAFMTETADSDATSPPKSQRILHGHKGKSLASELRDAKLEIEKLKQEIVEKNEKINMSNYRKRVVEREIQVLKEDHQKQAKTFLEKSDNDDRYIRALKSEIVKLRNKPPVVQTKILVRDKPVEVAGTNPEDLDQDSAITQNIKLKLELQKKEKIIQDLINEKFKLFLDEEGEQVKVVNDKNLSDEEKIIILQKKVQMLRQENEDISKFKFGNKLNDPDGELIKEISLENAKLRRRVDDLETRLHMKTSNGTFD